MFRTAFMSLSVSGAALARSMFVVHAKSNPPAANDNNIPAAGSVGIGGIGDKTFNFADFDTKPNADQASPVGAAGAAEMGVAGHAPDERNYSMFMAEPLTDEQTREKNKDSMRVRMELMIMKVQRDFCRALENEEDPRFRFQVDRWTRQEGGGGVTCILQDGHTFEKAGVNVSVVHGNIPPAAVKQMNSRGKRLPEGKKMPFFACGISSVIHPRNPNIPTIHFNYRYFEVEENSGSVQSWFGGGCDLTPYYLDEDDVVEFHTKLKATCDRHNDKYYDKFKAWCDDYFRIQHRGQSRGVGGIFFDDLDKPDGDACFSFVRDCANGVVNLYLPMVRKHRDAPYGYAERQWQLIRRGHYAEFNLVYDRGTKFGLYTPGARYESILMSLPLTAKWEYMVDVKEGSREAKLTEILKNPKQWV